MQCSSCGFANPEGMKFCGQCGNALKNLCRQCGFENPPGFKFCGECGTALTTSSSAPPIEPDPQSATALQRDPASYTPQYLAEKILTSRSALEGERKQVTVLFCDLANSTAIAERIGPEAMHTLLNRFFELALDDVHRYEGTINQFLGDGFMALFGAPIAHEDHARRGVLAALALQSTLQDHHGELGEPYGMACQFRMGLNSGIVVVGSIGDNLRMDYSAIGDTTNLASRLQGIAEPGEILVSESTSRLVEGDVRLQAIPPVEVKGKTDPVTPYKVIGTLPKRSPIAGRSERTLSQFVGRERELAMLDERLAEVEAGQGQVVGIVAEAGAGKSRLLFEFRQRLPDRQVTYLTGGCLSYGSAMPYHPLIDMVRGHCDIIEHDRSDAVIDKVHAALRDVGLDPDASAPYILQLLGVKEGTASIAMLTPEAMRSRTFAALTQLILQGSQHHPLIVEIEDLHWIDKTSEDYLSSLVESLAGTSVMLLATYRPGHRPPWLNKSYATQLSLRHLTAPDAFTVIYATRQRQELPAQMAQTIVEKAEGNPFFLEELTRAVIEQGEVHEGIIVPDTIQGVLSARIDRLPEEPRRLLQTASVLGREFSPRLLAAIWQGTEAPEALLAELKRLEFVHTHTGAEESVYVFKHALTQEVAYESLLTTRRQALHAAAGQALEQLYADRLEDAYDRLAYHYARTDHTAKAVAYLTHVAERAVRDRAYPEALAVYQEALQHAERLADESRDRRIVELVIALAYSFHLLGQRREGLAVLLRHQERLERLQDDMLIGQYHMRCARLYGFLGERQQARESVQRAMVAARRSHDNVTMGQAFNQLAAEEIFAGQLRQAANHSREAITRLAGTPEYHGLALAYFNLAWSCCHLGDLAQVPKAAAQCETILVTVGEQSLWPHAVTVHGWNLAMQGEWEAGLVECQRGLQVSPNAFTTAFAMGFLGYAYLEKGDITRAAETLEQAVEQAIQYRSRQVQTWFKTFLSEAYREAGRLGRARDLARQAVNLATEIKHPWGLGIAQRALGRIAHLSGNLAEAAVHLQAAQHLFVSIQAQYELARTHLDLASIARTQNNPDTATTPLSTACAWFKRLQVPRWVEKTEQLASDYGVTLTEVALQELTEGEV